MKLLWITTVEINYNGISDCMYQYLQAMDKSGMEIDILAVKPSNPEYEKRFRDLGLPEFQSAALYDPACKTDTEAAV